MSESSATAEPGRTRYVLGAIPLSRPAVVDFLRHWRVPSRGCKVPIVEQRPTPARRTAWLRSLAELDVDGDDMAAVEALLAVDDPMAHVARHATDRFIPRGHLDDDTYLERNLGGWAALWFGCIGLTDDGCEDPLLRVLEPIVEYGGRIAADTASPGLVCDRLDDELGDPAGIARGAAALLDLEDGPVSIERARALAEAIRDAGTPAEGVPRLLAFDALIELLYRVERRRRDGVAEGAADVVRRAEELQADLDEELGVSIMLKGEYVMGRSRRSTVLLAEGFDVVIKQPAHEPEHEIELAARTWNDDAENWPVADGEGRMQTPRARMVEVVSEEAVVKLDRAFGRDVVFSTALGLSVEPWESGPTLADLATDDHDELTAERYDEVLVHQLACEELDVDNPDWHAANFIVTGDGLVHVDWGAARQLEPHEQNAEEARERLDQVQQLAYSFQDRDLARRTEQLHRAATDDPDHLERLRDRARDRIS